jgi:two-component system, OmpR family, phosphate regulon response regulator OmpR
MTRQGHERMSDTIWILDDDVELGALLSTQFGRWGWDVRHLKHPRQLDEALAEAVPDLLVLDELLPGRRGTDVLMELRSSHPRLPVLMLSALGRASDRVAGLEAGANDYLGKPFLFRELQLRVQRLLLNAPHDPPGDSPADPPEQPASPQGWRLASSLHLDPGRLWLGGPQGAGHELSRGNAALLQLLCSRAGTVVSRQELGHASGSLVDPQASRSIDVRLSRLRRLLEDLMPGQPMIETVRGQGYRLVAAVEPLPQTGTDRKD